MLRDNQRNLFDDILGTEEMVQIDISPPGSDLLSLASAISSVSWVSPSPITRIKPLVPQLLQQHETAEEPVNIKKHRSVKQDSSDSDQSSSSSDENSDDEEEEENPVDPSHEIHLMGERLYFFSSLIFRHLSVNIER